MSIIEIRRKKKEKKKVSEQKEAKKSPLAWLAALNTQKLASLL